MLNQYLALEGELLRHKADHRPLCFLASEYVALGLHYNNILRIIPETFVGKSIPNSVVGKVPAVIHFVIFWSIDEVA